MKRFIDTLCVGCLLLVLTLFGPDAASASPGQITQFPVSGTWPSGIIAGSDHRLWFIEGGQIASITPKGKVTGFPGPKARALTVGPDDNVWFSTRDESSSPEGEDPLYKIGRITPSGQIAEYPLPTWRGEPGWNHAPGAITAGPGGLWFTVSGASRLVASAFSPPFFEYSPGGIGRISVDGEVTEFPLSDPEAEPTAITEGPDGNVWFAESVGIGVTQVRIGRVTPAGEITEFSLPGEASPGGIAAGPDGNLWFTEGWADRIGRMTPSGQVTFFALPTAGVATRWTAPPGAIVTGPDGNLWFTESDPSKIGRITPTGQITLFPLPDHASVPAGIAAGPDGKIWFAESRIQKISRLIPGQIGIDVKQANTRVKHGRAIFKLACAGHSAHGVCTGAVRLSLLRHAMPSPTYFAAARYRLRSGKRKLTALHLDDRAIALLGRAKERELTVIVSATVRGGYATSRAITLP